MIQLSKHACQQPIQGKLAYATVNNIVGRIVNGYHPDAADVCLLTSNAATALCKVQNYLLSHRGYGLFIYDAYRPKRAVMDFLQWSKQPLQNQEDYIRKQRHFPNIEKEHLFIEGYFAEDSYHCYGNTVDLGLINLSTNKLIEMGTIFDFMDATASVDAPVHQIGDDAFQNRKILQDAMCAFDFVPYEKEYWHFSHGGVAGREIIISLDIEITPILRGAN